MWHYTRHSQRASTFVHKSLSVVVVLFTTCSLSCSEDLPCTEHRVTVPRQCQSGRLLLSLEYVGQSFQISDASQTSRHFAVLANGDVICAGTFGLPVSGTVSFGVECRLGLLAWTELIHVTVADDEDVILSFTQPYLEGHVVENAPPKTAISGLHNISVSISNFQGRVVAGVDEHRTESNVVRLSDEEVRSQTSLKVQFSISEGPAYTFSLVDNDDGTVNLRTLIELDFERQSQHLLTVVAVVPALASTASARVRVYVDNINDNAPRLDRTEYNFRFDDVTRPEEVTDMRVTAFDPDNDQLTYSIDNEGDEFFIDSYTGEIYFRHLSAQRRGYEFRVYADDGLHRSDPSVVRVQMDLTDQSPNEAEPPRSRRDVRPLRLVEIPENMIGDMVDVGSGRRHEFFAFKDPAPRQLELGASPSVTSAGTRRPHRNSQSPTWTASRLRDSTGNRLRRRHYEHGRRLGYFHFYTVKVCKLIPRLAVKYFNPLYCKGNYSATVTLAFRRRI